MKILLFFILLLSLYSCNTTPSVDHTLSNAASPVILIGKNFKCKYTEYGNQYSIVLKDKNGIIYKHSSDDIANSIGDSRNVGDTIK